MNRVDVNCLLGNWPFRKLYKNTFEDLLSVHQKNGFKYGYVSSLNSIFYNDPFEGDQELHEIIKETAYKHILTINPLLPAFEQDIRKGLELFDIKGVRIYPCYHNYKLECKEVDDLCSILLHLGLPLVLTMRLEDERMNYLITPNTPSIEEISCFLEKHPENTVLLINIRYHEVEAIKEIINRRNNLYIDTSGLKDLLFVIEKLLEFLNADRLVYGSLHPLYCLKSTLLLVEKAQIDEAIIKKILETNAAFLNQA
jgi:Predicted metal-dependent hydrolase of the TIM-barrel fold